MNGTVLEEEGTPGGNGLFTLVFLLGRCSCRIPAGVGNNPAVCPSSTGTMKRSEGTRPCRCSQLSDRAGTVPLPPLNYQKVKQGMEADGNCCRQQARIPECMAGLWPALLPPHPIPTPGALLSDPDCRMNSPVIGRTLSVEFKARLYMATIKK